MYNYIRIERILRYKSEFFFIIYFQSKPYYKLYGFKEKI